MGITLAKDTLFGKLMLAATGRGKFSQLLMDAVAEGVSEALPAVEGVPLLDAVNVFTDVNTFQAGIDMSGGGIENCGTLQASGGDFSAGDVSNINLLEATNVSASGSLSGAEVLNASFVSGTSQAMVVRTAYTPENGALTTFTLPTTVPKGEMLEVRGYGAGGWKIAQNANQQIHRPAGSTTAGVGGSVDSATDYDGIKLLCVVANLTFVVIGQVGTPTFT